MMLGQVKTRNFFATLRGTPTVRSPMPATNIKPLCSSLHLQMHTLNAIRDSNMQKGKSTDEPKLNLLPTAKIAILETEVSGPKENYLTFTAEHCSLYAAILSVSYKSTNYCLFG